VALPVRELLGGALSGPTEKPASCVGDADVVKDIRAERAWLAADAALIFKVIAASKIGCGIFRA
jgi:hypothetical protein